MRRMTLARWLVVGALAGLGWLFGAEQVSAQPEPTPGVVQEGENEASISQAGTSSAGEATGGGQVIGITAGGGASVKATNTAEDSEAETGTSTVENTVGEVLVGPRSNVGTVSQDGDNEADVSQSATATSGDAVAGGQVIGIVAGNDIWVDLDNTSEDADAESGEANASNSLETLEVGPFLELDFERENNLLGNEEGAPEEPGVPLASAAVVPAQVGVAQAGAANPLHQTGDNEAEVDQNATAASGDAVAGSQVMGLVTFERGNINVSSRQSSDEPTAETGNATATNDLGHAHAGPELVVNAEVLVGDYAVTQEGDNEMETQQTADALTGDALAGAQVTGAVASGHVSISNENHSEDAEATSGNATAENTAAALENVGDEDLCADCERPVASVYAGPALTIAAAFSGDATVDQDGDNEVDFGQDASASSGDAVAGGQVTGVVAAGDVFVVGSNDSDDDEATSGDADAANTAAVVTNVGTVLDVAACDDCESVAGSVFAGPVLSTGFVNRDTDDLLIVQNGDNETDFGQDAAASTGDAVAGGQVTGVVAGGSVVVVLDGTTEDAEATSGDATATNVAAHLSNAGYAVGIDACDDCESVAGSVFAGPVLYADIAGGAAAVDQTGDNEVDFSQSAHASTGDAVAGGQVIGAVANGDVAVDASASSEDTEATSGDADASNEAATLVNTGTNTGADVCDGCGSPAASVFAGAVLSTGNFQASDANLMLTQTGDNEVDFSQSADAWTGDAVAGGQVAGVAAGGSAAIVLSGETEDAEASSGDADAHNRAAVLSNASTGLFAEACDLCESAAASVFAGPLLSEGAEGLDGGDVSLTQTGDNEVDFTQDASAFTGDAVAGGAVLGVVAGGDVAADVSSTSDDAEAESGDANASNEAAVVENFGTATGADACDDCHSIVGVVHAGPVASAGEFVFSEGGFTLAQDGDNEVDFGQDASALTGDAVAGGAVVGILARGSVDVVVSSDTDDADAESGDATAENTAAVASSHGTGEGADLCESCDSAAASVFAGPILSIGGEVEDRDLTLTQQGDDEVDFTQGASALTGDAVAGGAVIGIVAGGDARVDASSQTEDSDARSGDANSINTAAVIENTGTAQNVDACDECSSIVGVVMAGPVLSTDTDVDADVAVTFDGDAEVDFAQDADAVTGDAVAGAQVIGIVAADHLPVVEVPEPDPAVRADNRAEDVSSQSGDATAENTAAVVRSIGETGNNDACDDCDSAAGSVFAGPLLSVGGDLDEGASATLQFTGDAELDFAQDASASAGDSVASGQTIGVVNTGDGPTAIDASNWAEDADSDGGDATATNTAAVVSNVGAETCDECNSVAGAVFAGPVLSVDQDVDGTATLSQDGDNEADFSQSASAWTGDATAGAQVVGIVTEGNVSVVVSNHAEDVTAEGGDATAANVAAIVSSTGDGDDACDDCESVAGSVFAGPVLSMGGDLNADATLTQDGDNELDFGQGSSAAAGDAVAGAQVIGVVADGNVAIVASNAAEDAEATSGDADASNEAAIVRNAGGQGANTCQDCDSVAGSVFAGPVLSIGGDLDADATLTQDGDNELDFGQDSSAATGDAVAGGQVFGVVSGGDVAVRASSASEDAEATSGDAEASNEAGLIIETGLGEACNDCDSEAGAVFAGPVLSMEALGAGVAGLVHSGDNELELAQTGDAVAGDAVGGGQVTGVVAAGSVDADLDNTSNDDSSASGSAAEVSTLGYSRTGPVLVAPPAVP